MDATEKTEIAIGLGYVYECKEYENEAHRLHDAAMRGRYRSGRRWTSLPDPSVAARISDSDYYRLWQQLISARSCLRCSAAMAVVIDRPFCSECAQKIRTCDQSCVVEKEITPDRKTALRRRFAWLGSAPDGYKKGDACHFCKRTQLDEPHPGLSLEQQHAAAANTHLKLGAMWTWHFGKKKKCCTDCLQIRFRRPRTDVEDVASEWKTGKK